MIRGLLHRQALEIYAHKLRDSAAAERYCERFYQADSDEAKAIYLSLLQVYLQPREDMAPMVAPALSVMSRHYDKIDAAQALDMIPGSTGVQELVPFFSAVLARNEQLRRSNQVCEHASDPMWIHAL